MFKNYENFRNISNQYLTISKMSHFSRDNNHGVVGNYKIRERRSDIIPEINI